LAIDKQAGTLERNLYEKQVYLVIGVLALVVGSDKTMVAH